MRVTNEQAQLDIAKYLYHSETKKTVSPLVKKNYTYAADLLEAREFIDKLFNFTNSILDGSDDYTFSKIAVKEELAKLVKEYREDSKNEENNDPEGEQDDSIRKFKEKRRDFERSIFKSDSSRHEGDVACEV